MSRILRHAGVFACTALFFALPAGAAGDGGEGDPWWTFGWEVFNLFALIALIVYYVRAPIVSYFADRRERIREELKSAAQVLADAEARLAEWQARMNELDSELEKIRTMERRRIERERDKILEDARLAAQRIEREAGIAVDREMRRGQEELRQEAAERAFAMAESLLRERVGAEDQARLFDEFIARVESAPRARS